MVSPDSFSEYYGEYLDSSYDVLDRIVLRSYYSICGSAGGFGA